MNPSELIDLTPTLRLVLLALVVAALPLAWVFLRARRAGGGPRRRLAILTAVTLFLTFDLIVFGAFTRLTDSGLGCPDWPGCYGAASPIGATADIRAAEAALPSGPVTFTKAWIEMIHRYLAMAVGVLIVAMTAFAWREHRRGRRGSPRAGPAAADAGGVAAGRPGEALPVSPWWPTLTLVWVLVQGGFGKFTVTLKLYPAIVTLHLLGGLLLLVLLAVQHVAFQRPLQPPLVLPAALRRGAWLVAALLALQIALGGWVSTNYAVLACTGFPTCNGQWWPAMDVARGFTILRPLGGSEAAGWLSREALVAIHMAHRLMAVVVVAGLLVLAWRLRAVGATTGGAGGGGSGAGSGGGSAGGEGRATARRFALGLALLALAQVASGLSNVVLGWPIVAALAHSAGAAGLVLLMALLLARSVPQVASVAAPAGRGGALQAAA